MKAILAIGIAALIVLIVLAIIVGKGIKKIEGKVVDLEDESDDIKWGDIRP